MTRFMNRERAQRVQVGDEVRVNPSWNKTEQPARKILSPTTVVGIERGRGSQTGVLLEVRTATGTVKLDAGWFYS